MSHVLPSRLAENKNILVDVDRGLTASIVRNNQAFTEGAFTGNAQTIRISMMKLVQAVGTVQTRRTNPTDFQKLSDKEDLLELVKACDDFCIIKHNDVDIQRTLSEDFGVGLSVLVADNFYKIDWNTLTKIQRRRGSKPDIECFSLSSEMIVIEAKGTTSARTRENQKSAARDQKIVVALADVKVGSCALLKENSISDVYFFDPPFIPPTDTRYEKALLRADHYARVFNLIGQKELSKYFNLMRQRIVHNKNFDRFREKQNLFTKIRERYIKLYLKGRLYFGGIEKLNNELFVFTGIYEGLLSAFDFINFRDYQEDYFEEEGNRFYLLSDGLCIALLTNIRFLEEQIGYAQIPHHYEAFTLVDFDHSKESMIVKYLSYLFEKVGGKIQEGVPKLRPDLFVIFEDKRILVEVKKYVNSGNARFILESLMELTPNEYYKIILITNSELSQDIFQLFSSKRIALIDRTALSEIIERNEVLLTYMK